MTSSVAYAYSETEPWSAAWDRTDFRHPDWWQSTSAQPSQMGASTITTSPESTAAAEQRLGRPQHDEAMLGREAEASPHFGGRAQPGDVIGVETGGEQTHVGETTEDENDRRRDAEDKMATGSNRRTTR